MKFLLRLTALICIGWALWFPDITLPGEEIEPLVLLDVSESMDPATAERLMSDAKTLLGSNFEVLPFSGTAAPVAVASDSFENIRRSWSNLDIGRSNLEQGLQRAAGVNRRSVVLVSDGNENSGDARRAFPLLAASKLRVYPLVPDARSVEGSFRISHLSAPLSAAAQKSVDIRVSVENRFAEALSGSIVLTHGTKKLLEQSFSTSAGIERAFQAQSDPNLEGLNEITAQLTWRRDGREFRETRTIFLSGETRQKVLLLSGAPEDERLLKPLLQNQAYQLRSDAARGAVIEQDLQAIILNNIPYNELPRELVSRLDGFVRAGGGLLMIGGNRSFGLGGYRDTPVEPLLPVELVPPQTTKKRLNVAVQLVLDKSQSMAADERLVFAREASAEVVRQMKDDDYIGIIGFDTAPFIALPLGMLSDVRGLAIERIGRLYPFGKTNLFPAMDEARRALVRVNAGRKHVVILTDGKIPDEGPFYLELVKQMRMLGITVSTVLVGGESDGGMLRQMSELGGGAFYQTRDPSALPRIFLNDIRVSTGEKTMKESSSYMVRRGPDGLRSTEVQGFPELGGYVETKEKSEAELELVVSSGERAGPLLASWKVGKGRVAAYTSDANGRWSASWARWSEFQRFWGEVVDSLRTDSAGKERFPRFDLRHYVERGSLVLELAVFDAVTERVTVDMQLPDGSKMTLPFKEEGKGRLTAQLEKATAGKYQLILRAGSASSTPLAFMVSGEAFAERRGEAPNTELLEALARASSGAVNPTPDLLSREKERSVRTVFVAPYYLAGALVAFLLELLLTVIRRRSAKTPVVLAG